MPRKLPWLAEPAKKKSGKQAASSSSSLPKRKRASSGDGLDLMDSDLNALHYTPERHEKRRPARSPSTSPPPAPPDVEYMREGFHADDSFMMVEDEFVATAKLFTQNIHHAEYVRLKQLARSRGEGTLRSINRPMDGTTEQSKGLKLKLEAEARAKKIKDGLGGIGSEDDSSEDEYMQDPQLAGLMTKEKRLGKDLSGIVKAKSNTRAAAGFPQRSRNVVHATKALSNEGHAKVAATSVIAGRTLKKDVNSEDEDNLDATLSRPTKSSFANSDHRHDTSNGYRRGEDKTVDMSESSGIFKRFVQQSRVNRTVPNKSRDDDLPSSDQINSSSFATDSRQTTITGQPPVRSAKSAGVSEYLAKRRADKERKEREEKRKTRRADDVPTFLI